MYPVTSGHCRLFQALDITIVEEFLLKYGIRFPFESVWPASVVGHCGGVRATSRLVITANWPSTDGAYCIQLEFGLGRIGNHF